LKRRDPDTIILKPGRDKSVRQRHPWIFSGGIDQDAAGAPGRIVAVRDTAGKFLAWAMHSPQSQIRARVISWDETLTPYGHNTFIAGLVTTAAARRSGLARSGVTNAFRLVHGESDGLPGLIVDRYDSALVFHSLAAGIDHYLGAIVDALRALPGVRTIHERSDEAVRELEGLPERAGHVWGEKLPESGIMIEEHGLKILVDPIRGHKTGFYLDQRDARHAVGRAASGRNVLNCFSYTGGFGLHAAARGASRVLNVDTSAPALEVAKENFARNGLAAKFAGATTDVAELLRAEKGKGNFDFVILDPPKFAHNKSQIDKACRGYKDINRVAMQVIPDAGLLATFSCSGLISRDLFQKVVFGASLDAPAAMQIVEHFSQPADHPILLTFPEGEYLKGLLCTKVSR